MLKRLVNELRCELTITTTGPVLIKSGHASVSGPDMTPVRTYRNGSLQVYLPGSSLKGVVRSHLEKICRTLKPGAVCNPFITVRELPDDLRFSDVSCSDKFEMRKKWLKEKGKKALDSATVYHDSCPICRLFGSTSYIGRISMSDAYLASPELKDIRDGVGIDRLTGGAACGAKFGLEVVSSGVSFATEILLRNFECWQLGMLLLAIKDMEDELVRIGSGRSRGLGAVKAELAMLDIYNLAPTPDRQPGEVWGLGKFLGDGSYGTSVDDVLSVEPASGESQRGLRQQLSFSGDSLETLQAASQDAFVRRLETWPAPEAMQERNDWYTA